MNSRKLIEAVQQRSTRFRRVNFLISLVLPLLVFALAILLSLSGLFPDSYDLPLHAAAALVFLLVLDQTVDLLRQSTPVDAASAIDKALDGKERFVTLASAGTDENLALIETQSDLLSDRFELEQELPFQLQRPARYSLMLSPLVVSALVLLLWLRPSLEPPRTAEEIERSSALAADIRELARGETIPSSLEQELSALADTVEDHGLYSDEALQAFESAFEEADELAAAAEDRSEPVRAPDSADDLAKQNLPSDPASGEQAPPEAEYPREDKEQDTENAAMEQEQAENPQKLQPPEGEPPAEEQRSGEQQLAPKDDARQAESAGGEQQSKEQGAKQTTQESEQGEQARQGEGERQSEDDPKKAQTGVGEGKGRGQSGSQKQQFGESQSGSDERGAKEGGAENQSQAGGGEDSSGEKQPGEKQQGEQGRQGGKQQGAQQQKDGQQKSDGRKQDGDKQSAEQSGAKNVKERLGEMKQQMNEQNKPGKQQQQGKKQQQNQDQQQQQGAKSDAQQQGGEQDPKGSKSGSKQGQRQDNNAQQKGSNKQGGDNKDASDQSGEQQQGARKDSKGKGGERKDGEGAKRQQGEKATESRPNSDPQQGAQNRPQPGAKSQNPQQMPAYSNTAKRYGKEGGGEDGPDNGLPPEVDSVNLPQEEKIVIRGLGASDNKLYESEGGARARTDLGSAEFTKPEADVGSTSQPIPVEYGDILR